MNQSRVLLIATLHHSCSIELDYTSGCDSLKTPDQLSELFATIFVSIHCNLRNKIYSNRFQI